MYTMRRWWTRRGLQLVLIGVTLGIAWGLRQTQGAVLYESLRWMTWPLRISPSLEERLTTAHTLELQERLVELESQNQQLKALVGYTASQTPKGIPATVVGRSADHWWQQIILDRGSRDGVQVGYIVTGPGGLVGRITHITSRTSRVLLISDPSSQVGVTISRSRHTGFMRGQSTNQAIMQFFDKVPDVRRGDVVATSSFSQLFPSGLPVGRVVSVDLEKSPAPEATIELSAPTSQLEWVVIHPNRPALPQPKVEAPASEVIPGVEP